MQPQVRRGMLEYQEQLLEKQVQSEREKYFKKNKGAQEGEKELESLIGRTNNYLSARFHLLLLLCFRTRPRRE